MAEEKDLEIENLLRVARVRTLESVREERRLASTISAEQSWVTYFTHKFAVTHNPVDQTKLTEHQERLALYQSRRDIYSLAGRYARTHLPEDLSRLRMKQTEYYAAKAKEMETEAKEIEVEAKAIETAKPEEAVAKRREAQRKRREAKRVTERLLPPPEAYEQWQENLEELEKTMDKLEAQHKRYREMIETGMYVSFSRRKELQHLFAERYDKRQEIIEQAKPELSLSEYTQQYLRLKEEYEKRHGGV